MPNVPDRSIYDPVLDVHMHTGANARDIVAGMPSGHVAMDIETPGLDAAFTINCVTAAWTEGDKTQTVLLDPCRREEDMGAVRTLVTRASMLIFHNASFDVPALVHHGILGVRDISRIVDTLVLARYGWPDQMVKKSLGVLAKRHLGMEDNAEGMKLAFKAAGYRTIEEGFRRMDIDSPIYRQGAMLDTVATLRLQPILRQHCWDWSVDHPFEHFGATSHGDAEALLETQERVHRVMLRRTARGITVDLDYLNVYAEKVQSERVMAEAELAVHGLEGGSGKGAKLVEYLDSIGELPPNWPRTPTRKLKATKDLLEAFDHPLAKAQRKLAESDKVMTYLTKVTHQAAVTGRCHPQVGTLAASSTGRMSYSYPELQQFPADARPVLGDDGRGLTSIDWSQIEPVTMGVMAKDETFLAPYERGDDLYEPLMRAAGIDRPMAKIGLLADMYGQGEAGMANRLGLSLEQAAQIRRQIRAAMPMCTRWMARVQDIAANHGKIVTASGRILPVDQGGIFKAVNYIVQGSAYDVLAHAIVELDRAGLGDSIMLAMHDELVVETSVAEEAYQIMLTPPPFMEKWLGRAPILRGDRADMGSAWAKV